MSIREGYPFSRPESSQVLFTAPLGTLYSKFFPAPFQARYRAHVLGEGSGKARGGLGVGSGWARGGLGEGSGRVRVAYLAAATARVLAAERVAADRARQRGEGRRTSEGGTQSAASLASAPPPAFPYFPRSLPLCSLAPSLSHHTYTRTHTHAPTHTYTHTHTATEKHITSRRERQGRAREIDR